MLSHSLQINYDSPTEALSSLQLVSVWNVITWQMQCRRSNNLFTRWRTSVINNYYYLLVAFHCIALTCNYCFLIVVNKTSIYLSGHRLTNKFPRQFMQLIYFLIIWDTQPSSNAYVNVIQHELQYICSVMSIFCSVVRWTLFYFNSSMTYIILNTSPQ